MKGYRRSASGGSKTAHLGHAARSSHCLKATLGIWAAIRRRQASDGAQTPEASQTDGGSQPSIATVPAVAAMKCDLGREANDGA